MVQAFGQLGGNLPKKSIQMLVAGAAALATGVIVGKATSQKEPDWVQSQQLYFQAEESEEDGNEYDHEVEVDEAAAPADQEGGTEEVPVTKDQAGDEPLPQNGEDIAAKDAQVSNEMSG